MKYQLRSLRSPSAASRRSRVGSATVFLLSHYYARFAHPYLKFFCNHFYVYFLFFVFFSLLGIGVVVDMICRVIVELYVIKKSII